MCYLCDGLTRFLGVEAIFLDSYSESVDFQLGECWWIFCPVKRSPIATNSSCSLKGLS